MRVLLLLSFSLWIATFPASARADEIALTFQEAESLAVQNSNTLKAVHSDWQAADYQTAAQFQSLLPRLSIVGNYQYANYIPQVSIGPGPAIPFGTNSTYSVGPAVSYTVWDGLSSRRLYHSASLLAEARDQDVKSAKRQVLLSVRSAYIQVQLGVEELRLIQGSLDLARAQNRDVDIRFKAGSATRLDVVTSQRAVLSFEIQFKQRQANLSLSLRDLMTLLGRHESKILSRPGPPGTPNVDYVVRLDPLSKLLEREGQERFSEADSLYPTVRSQELQAKAYELAAKSQSGKEGPTIQVSGAVNYNLPSLPNPPKYWQEAVGVSLSMPLFFGDPSRALSAQQRSQAEAADYRAKGAKEDLDRDFSKSQELLTSLQDQRQLAYKDVEESEEEAKLNYVSYKAGKLNYVDVQNANNLALQSKVAATRIDAQILNQIETLKSLSGDNHDNSKN